MANSVQLQADEECSRRETDLDELRNGTVADQGVQESDELIAISETDTRGEEGRASSQLRQCPALSQVVVEEVHKLMGIAGPMAAFNYVQYLRAMVSVLCLGRLGHLQLAGGATAVSFTNITGYAVLSGLASGMDPVCGQAFGSGNKSTLGRTLQRMILILLTISLPISLLWLNLEPILLALGQDPNITRVASVYSLYSVPDLVAQSMLQPIKIYLKSQGLARVLLWCSVVAVAVHVPVNVVLVFGLKTGVPGVAVSAVVTSFVTVVLVLGYLYWSKEFQETWLPWSWACLSQWWSLMALAVPSCVGICLEWWWYEIVVIMAGYLPEAEVTVATTGVLIQATALMYALPHAVGSAASTRVGSELGAGRPGSARTVAYVAIACAEIVAVVSMTGTIVVREKWGRAFTSDGRVEALTATVLPVLGVCEIGNCLQTIGVGVLRGSARPTVGAGINLGSFYLVGTPVAVALAFRYGLGFRGLWFGLLAAQTVCAALVLLVVLRTDWDAEADRARQLVSSEANNLQSSSCNKEDYELVMNPSHHHHIELDVLPSSSHCIEVLDT